jgi:hypothetical protein
MSISRSMNSAADKLPGPDARLATELEAARS